MKNTCLRSNKKRYKNKAVSRSIFFSKIECESNKMFSACPVNTCI